MPAALCSFLRNLDMSEHKRIGTDMDRIAALDGQILNVHLLRNHIRILFLVRFAGVCPIEICKYLRSRIIAPMIAVVNDQTLYRDFSRHVTCLAEVVSS